MTVPPMPASARKQAPRRPADVHKAAMQAQRGLNRNMLVLGVTVLLLLGGLAVFLASRNGGSVFNIFQNTTNQIMHNSYFTQLIASGVTTEKDLKALAEIRPYGDGFIGVSKEPLAWEQAQGLAGRTGARILAVEAGSKQELLAWLGTTFREHLSAPVWLSENGAPSLLTGSEVLASKDMERQRKVLLHWLTTDQAIAAATKDKPFTNSLGMKFVPVPGTKVLFCIHETRRKDYATFATENSGLDDSWKATQKDGILVSPQDDYPVVAVSWEDARKFCTWLGTREGNTYRLPTDQEWSCAVGIGNKEARMKDTMPETLSGRLPNEYPWGNQFPPDTGNAPGNYADMAWHEKFPQHIWIGGYLDGFSTTAPVMTFKPNLLGIHDLGGNVYEWCEDWFNAAKKERVLRGGAWNEYRTEALSSSWRHARPPDWRSNGNSFRVVLELVEP
jgi:hypothetical protein